MNLWVFIIGILIILLITIFSLRFYIKKKKKKAEQLIENIPEKLMEIFNEAERRLQQDIKDGKKITPYQILWELSKGNRFSEQTDSIGRTEPPIDDRELPEQPNRRQDIQDGTTPSISRDKSRTIKPNRKSRRNFFSRFGRRR